MSAGLEWTRPLGLVALLLPLLVWLLSIRPGKPRPLASGTVSLWRRLQGASRGERRLRRVPPARRWLLAALVCGALALGGPRRARHPVAPTWRVLIDATPSMFLPLAGGGTRIEAAVAALRSLARQRGAHLSWQRAGTGEAPRPELPDEWLAAPLPGAREVRFEAYDQPGTVWLTDRAGELAPRYAGLCASGGEAVPGPVDVTGGRLLIWDGEELVEGDPVAPRRVAFDPALPPAVLAALRAWALSRGWTLEGSGRPALELSGVSGGSVYPVQAARDGWSLTGRGRAAPRSAGWEGLSEGASEGGAALETWLVGERTDADAPLLPLVTAGAGRVWVGLVEMQEAGGDSAAWAVSWGRLFDRVCLPPPGVVPLTERAAAGSSRALAPKVEEDEPLLRPPAWPLVALLSALAAGLALVALAVGRGEL